METTFMTIHNLSPEANIMFASESIVDILGFHPEEVTGRSCFEYFHPDELPFARRIHGRGVQMDKAAVLHYARIKNRDGNYVGCECVFTVVYEVLVACTSIYKGDAKNIQRAAVAPAIRRLFSSSPRDPRYHMLEHLSSRFRSPPQPALLEPRAALILNRFTRTLTVMYSTNAVSQILGVSPEQLKDKSFYECMQENCVPDAIRCLESAKANDSIAYLRFWYRDPRRQEDFEEEMREASQSSDSEDGGVDLHMDVDDNSDSNKSLSLYSHGNRSLDETSRQQWISRTSSSESANMHSDSVQAIFDQNKYTGSSRSSLPAVVSPVERQRRRVPHVPHAAMEPFELEAVVSCTSDGLVVVLRRARPQLLAFQQPVQAPLYANGLFAAPWGANPIRPHYHQPNQQFPFNHGLQAPQYTVGGPPMDEFMNSIREVAVFAWSLTGINGNIAAYGRGIPRGEAIPRTGLPIWDPYAQPSVGYAPPENQAAQRWASMGKTNAPMDGNIVPYQHSRQEHLLRYAGGYDAEPMGFDHPASPIYAPIVEQVAYHYQQEIQRDPSFHPVGENGHDVEMDQVQEDVQQDSVRGPSEDNRGNHYLWY